MPLDREAQTSEAERRKMPDKDEYPTEEELKTIREWRWIKNCESLPDLLEHIEDLWWCAETGFICKGKRILRVRLHTWGWSGNESIIEALQENVDGFWLFFWQESRRGGHYDFRIPLLEGKDK